MLAQKGVLDLFEFYDQNQYRPATESLAATLRSPISEYSALE
jgi:hypothetical protein